MSTVDDFFKVPFTLKRVSAVVGQSYETYQVIASGLCSLQAVRDKAQLLNANDWGKEHWIFCETNLVTYSEFKSKYGDTVTPNANDIITIDNYDFGIQGVSDFTDPFEDDDDSFIKIVVVRKTTKLYEVS